MRDIGVEGAGELLGAGKIENEGNSELYKSKPISQKTGFLFGRKMFDILRFFVIFI